MKEGAVFYLSQLKGIQLSLLPRGTGQGRGYLVGLGGLAVGVLVGKLHELVAHVLEAGQQLG